MNPAVGVDFGTTNSAIASIDAAGKARLAAFPTLGQALAPVFRSILFFETDVDWVRGRPPASIGHEAIAEYLATGADGRLMQSMKSFLASRHVVATNVFGHNFTLESLIALVVARLRAAIRPELGVAPPTHVVAGRPVHFAFANGDDDDAFAEGRLRKAFALAGFEQVSFVPEPVAAALHYASGLDHDEIVLVADFGGGTSDFSVLRVGPEVTDDPADASHIIGTAGVGVAGDNFDARLIDRLVAPALGKGSHYRSQTGKILEIPPAIYHRLERWHELSLLKTPRMMDSLYAYRRDAREPDKIGALIDLVDHDLGYALYAAVEQTKVALSRGDSARFSFRTDSVEVEAPVTRDEFEAWIQPDLDALTSCLDGLLADVGLAPADVDTVFVTGGTALVPAVRALFEQRFGADKLRSGDFLASVASGLARYATRL
ncbi:MAG: Hsp70 family protein [Deltaproteobacteria bacterium HGW-Deltaproteobacteria-14]|nr:MAG: Hsp70 family protein [Deltaproteobacteria bacterium HGW-Deltaproteobacteria-14]